MHFKCYINCHQIVDVLAGYNDITHINLFLCFGLTQIFKIICKHISAKMVQYFKQGVLNLNLVIDHIAYRLPREKRMRIVCNLKTKTELGWKQVSNYIESFTQHNPISIIPGTLRWLNICKLINVISYIHHIAILTNVQNHFAEFNIPW